MKEVSLEKKKKVIIDYLKDIIVHVENCTKITNNPILEISYGIKDVRCFGSDKIVHNGEVSISLNLSLYSDKKNELLFIDKGN